MNQLLKHLLYLTLFSTAFSIGQIHPIEDINLSVLNQGAPANLHFSFKLDTQLLTTDYMYVTFPR